MILTFPFLFRLSYHLLVLAGFLSLALTEALNSLILAFGFTAWISSFFKETRRPGLVLSKGVGNGAALTALVFGLLDYFLMSGDLVIASAHFLVFIQAIKLFSLNDNRDYYQLYGLSFFGLVSAAGLTSSLSFVFSFLFYLLMLTWTLILHHFKEETDRSGLGSKTGSPYSASSFLSARFLMSVSLIALLSFFMTLTFFYAIPRIGFGYLRSQRDGRRLSGFSKTIDLGVFGPVKLDPKVVMRIEVTQGRELLGMAPVHWRGMVFDYYDGRSWKNCMPSDRIVRSGPDGAFRIREKTNTRPIVEQVFYMEPLDIDVVFSYPGIFSLSASFPYLTANRMGIVKLPLLTRGGARLKYTVRSEISLTQKGRELNTMGSPTGDNWDSFLQLPEQSEDIRRLAHEVAEGFRGDFQRVEALERFLREEYTYSLNVKRNPAHTPIHDFLFHQKRGYCEHFATAMTLMVRALGIPARLISGFYGGEWNDFGKYYLVQQRDAHTWVEVYFPTMGWVTFEPTPPGLAERPSLPIMKGFLQFVDSLRLKWNRYIINYRLKDQITVVRTVHRRGIRLKAVGRRILQALRVHYHLWSRKAPPWQRTLALVLTVLGISGILYVMLKKWQSLSISKGRAKPQSIKVEFYRAMIKILEGRGLSRADGITPLEFAHQVIRSNGPNYNGVLHITHFYNRLRFGGVQLSHQEMGQIRSTLKNLQSLPGKPRSLLP